MQRSVYIKKIVLLVMLCVLAQGAMSQSDSSKSNEISWEPSASVFNEIYLSDEGVQAVDTFGYEWFFDFRRGVFVQEGSDPGSIYGDDRQTRDIVRDLLPHEERCTVERKVSPIERMSVTIGQDEYVDGDVSAWGRITVKGWVKGSVRSVGKRVLVMESGRVDGDIEAPEVVVKSGAVVSGEIIEGITSLGFRDLTVPFSADGIVVVLCLTLFLLFCTFLVTVLAPRQVTNFYNCVISNKVKTYFVGFLFLVLMPVILVLVTITIIGIFVLPLVPVIYLVAIILGVITFGNHIGHLIILRFRRGDRNLMSQSMFGVTALMGLWLVTAVLLGSGDSTINGFGIFFLVVSILISSFPLFSGIGAALLTRFGFRECVSWRNRGPEGSQEAPSPEPPPIPEPPVADQSDPLSD